MTTVIPPEPKIYKTLKYAGEPKILRRFLLYIYDVLDRYSDIFVSDKRKINWVSAHFGSTSQTKTQSTSQALFLVLLERNALMLGINNA